VSQQQQQPPEHQELLLQALLAAQPPATPINWPWRPRDLQALRAKFNLLVHSSTNISAAAAAGRDRSAQRRKAGGGVRNSISIMAGGLSWQEVLASAASYGSSEDDGSDSVLTYEGFLGFWAEAGLKDWLTKVRGQIPTSDTALMLCRTEHAMLSTCVHLCHYVAFPS
jgi:hypothetical protein